MGAEGATGGFGADKAVPSYSIQPRLVSISRGASLAAFADDYLSHLRRCARSLGTLRSYGWVLEGWVRSMVGQGVRQPADIELRHVEAWQDGVAAGGASLATQSIAISAVRGMLRWGAGRQLVDGTIWAGMVQVRVPARLPRPLAEVDLDRILVYYRRRAGDLVGLRDRALFFYLLTTGARISEALQVDVEMYKHATTVRQKGGTDKMLIAAPIAEQAVVEYLRARADDCPALFVTHDNNRPTRRLNAAGAREIWRRLAYRLGVPRFTTHQLRHSCATELLDQGVAEIVVAEQLGHRKLDTVKRYAQVRTARREEAMLLLEKRIGAAQRPVGVLRSIDRRRRRRD